MREHLLLLLSACDIFQQVSPEQMKVLLWLRLHQLPCYLKDFEVGLSEKQVRTVLNEYKTKGLIGQRVIGGPWSLTQKGNAYLDSLLVKIR